MSARSAVNLQRAAALIALVACDADVALAVALAVACARMPGCLPHAPPHARNPLPPLPVLNTTASRPRRSMYIL
ncbi:hypothetical protein EXIGLDRAFT_733359 [Exidia glandulosa HHB12029]|uniref:Secreted protein n=1 Tax=Exidia glandulosa HHB12029 TaxID=1314781 RepID=A0A165KJN4_EXIGL|nr:hypothetical protein EXIGLDRAFT_733359 [Exidia glandulosa HHB12029]